MTTASPAVAQAAFLRAFATHLDANPHLTPASVPATHFRFPTSTVPLSMQISWCQHRDELGAVIAWARSLGATVARIQRFEPGYEGQPRCHVHVAGHIGATAVDVWSSVIALDAAADDLVDGGEVDLDDLIDQAATAAARQVRAEILAGAR